MASKLIKITIAVFFSLAAFLPGLAFAGGFSTSGSMSRSVSAKALATNYSNLSSRRGYIKTKNYAKVGHYTVGKDIMKGFAEAGNKVQIYVNGKACNGSCSNGRVVVDQKSVAKSKIYIKNKNILAKAYAKNYVKVKVQGELYFENEEYSYAAGRFTPLGTQMQAGAINRNKLEGKGLIRLDSGQVVRVSGQVKK